MTSDADDAFPRRRYLNPPVVEAIARLHLKEPLPWSLTTPGLLFSRLSSKYPDEPKMQNVMQAQMGPSETDANTANLQLSAGPQKVVFGAENGTKLLIAGPTDISVHGLPPYEGWESLEARLFEALQLIGDLIPAHKFDDLGVRYINRIEIPRTEFNFEEYLTIAMVLPPGFPSQVNAFLDRIESAYPDGKSRISFTWATTDAPEDASAFLIDLDLGWSSETSLNVDEARAELQSLKQKETRAFESLLQESLREAFDEVH